MTEHNFSGIGYISEIDSPDADFFQIHGTAIGNNDITVGNLSGERKLWPPEILEPAASSLEGKEIVVNHENQDAYKVVGEVTDARFSAERGVIYQGLIDDSELARKIGLGWLEVSPRIVHTEAGEERNDVFVPDEVIGFDNLSIVNRGAAHSNAVDLGEHDELMAEELQEAFDARPEADVAEFQLRPVENQEGVDFSDWLYETPEGAQGATASFPCEGIHEHNVEGDIFYAPCASHEQFLRSLSEREEMEEEELEEALEETLEELATHIDEEIKQLASRISSHTQLTRAEAQNFVDTIRPDAGMVDGDVLAKVVAQAIGGSEKDMRQIISKMQSHNSFMDEMSELEDFAEKIAELEDFEDVDSESVVEALEGLTEDSEETDDSQHGSPDVSIENLLKVLGDD